MVKKIKPDANIEFDTGMDGRDSKYLIKYRCPKCGNRLYGGQMACEECGAFFDWSKKARIKVSRSIEWEE